MTPTDPPRAASLPAAEGVIGHLRHTWAVVRLLRTWRRHYQRLDDSLRDAVQVRDVRLAELGDAGYAVRDQLPDEVAAFAGTLDDMTAEQARADERLQGAGIDQAAAEAARTEALAQREGELRGARAALAGPERQLAELDARLDALDREATARKGQRAAALDQIDALDPGRAEDEGLRARHEAQRGQLLAKIEAWDADERTQAEQRQALAPSRAELQAAVEGLGEQFSAAKDAYREARQAHDTRVEAAKAAVVAAQNALDAVTARRRAVAIDLARAVLQQDGLELPGRATAEEAVARIEAIRTERAALDAEWASFDGSAARRTGFAIGGILVALLILWIAI